MASNTQYPVKAVRTTFRVIEELDRQSIAGVTDLAEATDISKGSVHKHLATLQSLGYVVQDGTKYRLSYRFLGIGNQARERNDLLHAAASSIDNLSDLTNETVNLMIPEREFGVYLYRAGSISDIGGHLPPIGRDVHLHATAGGKTILSRLDPTEVDAIVDSQGLPALTDKTITSRSALRDELQSVRDCGLAFERGEHLPSVQCVAAPIMANEDPVGAVSVSGNINEMSGKKLEEDLAGLVVSTANEIEHNVFRSDHQKMNGG